jgi:hypothetical protein
MYTAGVCVFLVLKKLAVVARVWTFEIGRKSRISHTNLKNRMVISRIATLKNHMEFLVPGQN